MQMEPSRETNHNNMHSPTFVFSLFMFYVYRLPCQNYCTLIKPLILYVYCTVYYMYHRCMESERTIRMFEIYVSIQYFKGHPSLSGHSMCTTSVYKLDVYSVAGSILSGSKMRL